MYPNDALDLAFCECILSREVDKKFVKALVAVARAAIEAELVVPGCSMALALDQLEEALRPTPTPVRASALASQTA